MREAIRRAGFEKSPLHRVWTATEPEAAALAVFSDNFQSLRKSKYLTQGLDFVWLNILLTEPLAS
jgi:hypothetical protein